MTTLGDKIRDEVTEALERAAEIADEKQDEYRAQINDLEGKLTEAYTEINKLKEEYANS